MKVMMIHEWKKIQTLNNTFVNIFHWFYLTRELLFTQ